MVSLRAGKRSRGRLELVNATKLSSVSMTDEDLVPPDSLLMERMSKGSAGPEIVNSYASLR